MGYVTIDNGFINQLITVAQRPAHDSHLQWHLRFLHILAAYFFIYPAFTWSYCMILHVHPTQQARDYIYIYNVNIVLYIRHTHTHIYIYICTSGVIPHINLNIVVISST